MFNSLMSAFNINIVTAPTALYADMQVAKIQSIIEGNGSFNDNANALNTIFTCKKILTETLSKMPLQVLKNGKKFKDHKLYNLIRYSPNSYQTSNVWISTAIGHLCDTGNFFCKINKVNGKVVNLQIKHPKTFKGYKLNTAGVLIYSFIDEDINGQDLIHFKIYSDDGIIGTSPLAALNKLMSINFQAGQTIDSYYKNGLHSNKALKSMSNVDGKDYNRAQQEWAKSHTGSLRAGEIMNLPYGSEIQELKLEFTDAHLLPSLKFTAEQIGAAYGIPNYMLGLVENSKNIEESLLSFEKQTIQPIATIISEELEAKLLTDKEKINDDVTIELDLKVMMATDSNTRATYLKTLKDAAIISANEAAVIEGFDTYEGGQYHYQQSQYQPLELITKDGEFKPVTTGNSNLPINNSDNTEPQ
jgi:HK97 family phage portal protein